MPALRIGLLGCGHIGRLVHLETLCRLPDAEVAALAEPDTQCREAARQKVPRAAISADYHEVLERSDIDAVVVCLPNALHAEAGIAALQGGKHLYLEKPLALNLEDGRKLVDAWRRSGRVAMIGFNYRFNPLHRVVRRYLQSGKLGELVGVRSVFTSALHRTPEWKQRRETGGGVLLNLGSHHVDLVHFWFNQQVIEVRASVRSDRAEDDTATLDLSLANGLLVQSFFSMSSVDDDRFEIYGRSGKLCVDRYNSWAVEVTGSRRVSVPLRCFRQTLSLLPRSRFALDKLLAPGREPSFASALAHFVESAQNDRQSNPNFEDGFQSLAVIIAAEESARTNKSVALRS